MGKRKKKYCKEEGKRRLKGKERKKKGQKRKGKENSKNLKI